MNFWNLIYCLFTGAKPEELQERQTRRQIPPSSQQNPISPDPNIYTYRTKDGTHYFQFSYHKVGNSKYEIDIEMTPPYNSISQDCHVIHVLFSPRQAQHKICITSGKEPKTLNEAMEVSKAYAELISNYILYGTTPDQQIAQQ